MKKVFISHPFQNDPEENLKKTDKLLENLRKKYPDILFHFTITPIFILSVGS